MKEKIKIICLILITLLIVIGAISFSLKEYAEYRYYRVIVLEKALEVCPKLEGRWQKEQCYKEYLGYFNRFNINQ